MKRPLLFSAHPGHELRVYGWLKQTKPAVWSCGQASLGCAKAVEIDRVAMDRDAVRRDPGLDAQAVRAARSSAANGPVCCA